MNKSLFLNYIINRDSVTPCHVTPARDKRDKNPLIGGFVTRHARRGVR